MTEMEMGREFETLDLSFVAFVAFAFRWASRSSESTDEYARKVLDTADIVIALGKAWKRGNRDETVKLLDGIQRV